MGPTNRPEFTWSFIRFYLFWLLTTLLILFPLLAFFGNVVECNECKRKLQSVDFEHVENVNYKKVNNNLNSLVKLVESININDPSKLHLKEINEFYKNFNIINNEGKKDSISIKIRDIAAEVSGLAERYEEKIKLKNATITSKDTELIKVQSNLKDAKFDLKQCREYQGLPNSN